MSEFAMLICSVLLSVLPHSATVTEDIGLDVCGVVADTAWDGDAPVPLTVALAYHESKMDPYAVSRAGAIGPLQILPMWTCPEVMECRRAGKRRCSKLASECNPIEQGVVTVRRLLVRNRWDRRRAVCAYTGCAVTGNTGFVAQVLATTSWLESSLECQCSLPRDKALRRTLRHFNTEGYHGKGKALESRQRAAQAHDGREMASGDEGKVDGVSL